MPSVQRVNKPRVLTDEYRSKILRILQEEPEISQCELARSFSKANYCPQGSMKKGLVKANNFKISDS